MNKFLYPYDPLNGSVPSSGDPDRDAMSGCLGSLVAIVIAFVVLSIMSLFTSCTTQRIVSDEVTDHRVSEMLARMDSLMHVKTVVQQDSTWRQEILRQFQSIRERSDTSHTVVQDTAGNVIRERIVINNTREVTSETDREQLTVMASRLEVMDSTLQVMQQSLQRSDSLLHEKQQTVEREVAKPLSWWQQLQIWMGRLVLVALAVCAGWFILKKKAWWLKLLRK